MEICTTIEASSNIQIYKRNLNGVTIMYNGDNASIRYFVFQVKLSTPGMGYPL